MIHGRIRQLGAEHLVELGKRRDRSGAPKRPYLLGRHEAAPRDVVDYLGQTLSAGLHLTAEMIDAPPGLMGQGEDYVATNTAAVLGEIPAIGELVASVVLTGNAILHFRIPVSDVVPAKLETILRGLERAMSAAFDDDTNNQLLGAARDEIVKQAPENMKGDVNTFLVKTPAGQRGGDATLT